MMKLGLIVAALAVACPLSASAVTFNDSAMNLANYAVTTYANPGFTTSTTQGAGTIQFGYEKTGPSTPAPRFQALNAGFVYDPSAQGAIDSIDASMDQFRTLFHNGSAVSFAGAVSQFRLLAAQDGKTYEAFFNLSAPPVGAWFNTAKSGLLASDFFFFDPANPYAPRTLTGLDFAGSAITFGFEITGFGVTVNGGPSTGLVQSSYAVDNFQVAINGAAVPEPASWALLIGGFGVAGVALRRRRRLLPASLA